MSGVTYRTISPAVRVLCRLHKQRRLSIDWAHVLVSSPHAVDVVNWFRYRTRRSTCTSDTGKGRTATRGTGQSRTTGRRAEHAPCSHRGDVRASDDATHSSRGWLASKDKRQQYIADILSDTHTPPTSVSSCVQSADQVTGSQLFVSRRTQPSNDKGICDSFDHTASCTPTATSRITIPEITLLRHDVCAYLGNVEHHEQSAIVRCSTAAMKNLAPSPATSSTALAVLPLSITLAQVAAHVRHAEQVLLCCVPSSCITRGALLLSPSTPPAQRSLPPALFSAHRKQGAGSLDLLHQACAKRADMDSSLLSNEECVKLFCAPRSKDLVVLELDTSSNHSSVLSTTATVIAGSAPTSRTVTADSSSQEQHHDWMRLRNNMLSDAVTLAIHMLKPGGAFLIVMDNSMQPKSSPAHNIFADSDALHRLLRWRFSDMQIGVTGEGDASFVYGGGAAVAANTVDATGLTSHRVDTPYDDSDFPGFKPRGVRRDRHWKLRCTSRDHGKHKERFFRSVRPQFTGAQLTGEALIADLQRRVVEEERATAADAEFFGVAFDMVAQGQHYTKPDN